VVSGHIEVENEAAKKLVESNLSQLYNSLSGSGVQLNSLNISLSNNEQKANNKQQHNKRKLASLSEEEITEEKPAGNSKILGYNTYEYLV